MNHYGWVTPQEKYQLLPILWPDYHTFVLPADVLLISLEYLPCPENWCTEIATAKCDWLTYICLCIKLAPKYRHYLQNCEDLNYTLHRMICKAHEIHSIILDYRYNFNDTSLSLPNCEYHCKGWVIENMRCQCGKSNGYVTVKSGYFYPNRYSLFHTREVMYHGSY